MQVILLDDVKNVGREGDIVEVATGYGRNYLIPRGLAAQATGGALKELQQRGRAIEQRQEQKQGDAQEVASRLREQTVVIEASVGEGGRLHGQVTAQQIAEAIGQQFDLDVDRRDIDIPVPIRETGDYLISATLYKNVTAQLPISVVAPGAQLKQEEVATVAQEVAGEDETEEASA